MYVPTLAWFPLMCRYSWGNQYLNKKYVIKWHYTPCIINYLSKYSFLSMQKHNLRNMYVII